jgi:hypothetical protein
MRPNARSKRGLLLCTWVVALVCWVPQHAQGYVMPGEQVLDLMAVNFSQFKTLVVTQTTRVTPHEKETGDTVLEETIWFKAPGWYYSEIKAPPQGQGTGGHNILSGLRRTDLVFRELLMANRGTALGRVLTHMGVNLGAVALTRFNGIIAYQVGDSEPETPSLLIEKERFLPLFLSYRLPGDSLREMVRVSFEDYRKLEEGWYPYKIEYVFGNEIKARYVVLHLEVNVPIGQPLIRIPEERMPPSIKKEKSGSGSQQDEALEKAKADPHDARLQEMIRRLREKYR